MYTSVVVILSMEHRTDEDAKYPIENEYLLHHVIKSKIPGPVAQVVRDYFSKAFDANLWVAFDAGMPCKLAVDIFLAWLCDYNNEDEFGMYSVSFDVSICL